MMMAVLFLLFQCSMVLRDMGNDYEVNAYTYDGELTSNQQWEPVVLTDGTIPEGDYAVYIGGTDQEVYHTIETWCRYRKMSLAVYASVPDYTGDSDNEPCMILIDGANLDCDQDLDALTKLCNGTVPLVFATIPEAEVLMLYPDYMSLLGITWIDEPSEEVVGIHVLDGFLLGGESFYYAEEEDADEEDPIMDMDLDMVYYRVFTGAKVYVMGMYEETPEETESQPPLLWRYATTENQIYVFYGRFLQEEAGVGYLNAIMAEMQEYDIYPIVNAQVLSVVNYPSFAEDNADAIQEIYSRSQRSLYQDLIWPDLISVMLNSGFQGTFFLTAQVNYAVDAELSSDNLLYYLMQLKEQDAEAGISLSTYDSSWITEKLSTDEAFLDAVSSGYTYSAFYMEEDQLDELENYLDAELLSDICTVVSNGTGSYTLIDYLQEDVTIQGITGDALDYHYSDDLRLKSYETGLGYSNVLFDATNISFPYDEEDEWQNVQQELSSVLCTYWEPYSYLDTVTASEADRRIRNFLALSYEDERAGSTLTLNVDSFEGEAWFILRLHGEDVVDADGAEYEEIEADVYLIHATSENVELELQPEGKQVKIQ